MKRDFDLWLGKFKQGIYGYDFYVDFDKILRMVEEIKVELHILNSLIGSPDIASKFKCIIQKYPETLKCIPILLVVRSHEIFVKDGKDEYLLSFESMNYTVEQYIVFMRKTGLFDLMANKRVNNLVDYILGVETGMDSNARKNRSGALMENLVESYIQQAGFARDVTYFNQMKSSEIQKKMGN